MSGTGAGSEDGAKSMTDEEAAEVARQVKEKVVEKLSGEDADVVVTHAGERMTGKLVEEGYADDLMRDIQEIVLENLPGVRKGGFVNRAMNSVVDRIVGRHADTVIEDVNERMIQTFVENGYSDELIDETLEVALQRLEEKGYVVEIADEVAENRSRSSE